MVVTATVDVSVTGAAPRAVVATGRPGQRAPTATYAIATKSAVAGPWYTWTRAEPLRQPSRTVHTGSHQFASASIGFCVPCCDLIRISTEGVKNTRRRPSHGASRTAPATSWKTAAPTRSARLPRATRRSECLRSGRWDLIILDINMPDRSGLDILRHVRASYPDTKVLVLSAL